MGGDSRVESVSEERIMGVAVPILFVSHSKARCGVHQFGRNVAEALRASRRYDFQYVECGSPDDLRQALSRVRPVAVVFNYYPSTLPWLRRRHLREIAVPHLGILHEVTQKVADAAGDWRFDYWIAPDPTLLLSNPLVFKTGRLVPRFAERPAAPPVTTIGSFGFGLGGKGFERLIDTVQEQFDEAVIRLHIPYADFGDSSGAGARAIAATCRARLRKPRIRLELSHDFLSQEALLAFLAGNTLNAFFYEEQRGRGIASVTDHALAVGRPIAITRSTMFRHLWDLRPSICVEEAPLPEIIARGTSALDRRAAEWSPENLVWDYERIVSAALAGGKRTLGAKLTGAARRLVRAPARRPGGDWTPRVGAVDGARSAPGDVPAYSPPAGPRPAFNRVLDQSAREEYAPALAYLGQNFPEILARKIAQANVQQAFVLDTVSRLAPPPARARLLCVGSFEDTASAALALGGYSVEEVDPVINYDLTTFLTKPSCARSVYDVVFSTSVIEHVEDDERFVREIGELLAPGGVGVLTCDFADAWRAGDPRPAEDFRIYTRQDFRGRLLPLLPDCRLEDEPRWDGAVPDFSYGGCRYGFATLVFRKAPADAP
jgi:SAM-dependent methyltransferase